METTHQTNYDIFMENFSKKFDEEVKPLFIMGTWRVERIHGTN